MPTCSTRPSLITTISSATSMASSWSWVTNTVVTGTSSCSRRSQSRSSLRTLASRAPNGSSSSSTVGSTASARARAMRWRWPPESWAGSRCANCDRCTSSSSSSTRCGDLGLGPLADLQAEGDVLGDGHVLEDRVVLEDEADVALLGRQAGGVDTLDRDRAGVGGLEAGDDRAAGSTCRRPTGRAGRSAGRSGATTVTSSSATKSPKRLVTFRISMLTDLSSTGSGACLAVGGGRR